MEGRSDSGADVAVVLGSAGQTRICPAIAAWVRDALQIGSSLSYRVIDLANAELPFLNEPPMAALGRYEHQHTRAWSRLVDECRGFVFVLPQYSWGYPAPLKNALDCLSREWRGKPVTLVTYGTRGADSSTRQIRELLAGLHMRPLADHLELCISEHDVDEDWQLKDPDGVLRPYFQRIRELDRQMTESLRAS